jgi:hypothetical protein
MKKYVYVSVSALAASVASVGLAALPASAAMTPQIYDVSASGAYKCAGSPKITRGYVLGWVSWTEIGQDRALQVEYKLPKKKKKLISYDSNVMFSIQIPKKMKPGVVKFRIREAPADDNYSPVGPYGAWSSKQKVRFTKPMVNKVRTFSKDSNTCAGF